MRKEAAVVRESYKRRDNQVTHFENRNSINSVKQTISQIQKTQLNNSYRETYL